MDFIPYSPERWRNEKINIGIDSLEKSGSGLAVKYNNGILLMGENPSSTIRITSEVFDRIAIIGTGQTYEEIGTGQTNQYETLKKLVILNAEFMGLQDGDRDVSAYKLAKNVLSPTIGTQFNEGLYPFEVEFMLAELGKNNVKRIYHVMFTGTISEREGFFAIGSKAYKRKEEEDEQKIVDFLRKNYQDFSKTNIRDCFLISLDALKTVKKRTEYYLSELEVSILDTELKEDSKFRTLSIEEIKFMTSNDNIETIYKYLNSKNY